MSLPPPKFDGEFIERRMRDHRARMQVVEAEAITAVIAEVAEALSTAEQVTAGKGSVRIVSIQ